jgi:hypothetical protein
MAAAPTTSAHGSSETATCPVAPAPVSGHRIALRLPRALWLQLPPPGLATALGPTCALWPRLMSPCMGQLWDRHVPHGGSYELQAIKVNKYLLATRPSWSPSGRARISSKALCDKVGACKTCGQEGCRPATAQHRCAARS